MRISNILALAVASVVSIGTVGTTAAKSSNTDHRVYIAPLASYSFGDDNSLDPEDQLGFSVNVGLNLTKWLAL